MWSDVWNRFRHCLAFALMTPSRLSLLAALGVACLASTVLLVKTTPAPKPSIWDSIYN